MSHYDTRFHYFLATLGFAMGFATGVGCVLAYLKGLQRA